MLEKLIDQLVQELGTEKIVASTETRHYRLPFDNEIEVEAEEFEKSFLLKGIIGKKPEKNTESFFMQVMEANLFGIGTRGGVIGLNEEGKLLTLSLEVDYNSSYKDFKEKIEDFISVLDFWRNETLKHQ